MSRPLKQGLDYFPHDTDAVNDPKMKSLMAIHGAEGYSFYFILLEIIFRTENYRIMCGKPIEKAGLAHSMCISPKKFDSILETALEIGCFDPVVYQETKCLTSNGIHKRISKVNELRHKERIRKETIKYKVKEKEKEKAKTGKLTENSRKTHKSLISDEEWISSLKENPAYLGINIENEHGKCVEWFKNIGKTVSRKRLLNWLNKAERPLNIPKEAIKRGPTTLDKIQAMEKELGR